MYGEPDEWDDNLHEMNAVDDYIKRRNQGLIGGLSILSFEDEKKSRKKKEKKKDKDKDRSHKNRPHSHGGELFLEDEEDSKDRKKKDKKEKKEKKDKKNKKSKGDDSDDDNRTLARERSAPAIQTKQSDIDRVCLCPLSLLECTVTVTLNKSACKRPEFESA